MTGWQVPVRAVGRGATWEAWLDRLPRLVDGLLAEWELRVDRAAMHGLCSVVLPVRTADGITVAIDEATPRPGENPAAVTDTQIAAAVTAVSTR